jgi:hypothetical protein
MMFTIADRDHARDRILALAASDARVVGGAVVGSLALADGDPWSDLDLTFAVEDRCSVPEVLDDWTRTVVADLDGVKLFDLPSGSTIYRVFLLPGCLQLDLSFTPASQFGAAGPKFRLLFGRAIDRSYAAPPAAADLFGYAVHHAVRARTCIERGRDWQAEYWISALRDHALSLACRRLDLPAYFGRGFDDLPAAVLDAFRGAIVRSVDRTELLRALREATSGLLRESDEIRDLAARLQPDLLDLIAPPE